MTNKLRSSIPVIPQRNPGEYVLLRLFNVWPDTEYGQYWQVQRVDPARPEERYNLCVGEVALSKKQALLHAVTSLKRQAAVLLTEAATLQDKAEES